MNTRNDKLQQLRERAENRLDEFSRAPQQQDVDIEALLHDLHVYHAEIEIQFEELQAANARAEETQRQYSDLFEFAPVGYLLTDRHGRVQKANRAAVAMLEHTQIELQDRLLAELIHREKRDNYHQHRRQALRADGSVTCEVLMLRASSDSFYARLNSVVVQGQDTVLTAITDLTTIKQAQDALQNFTERLEQEVMERTSELEALYKEQETLLAREQETRRQLEATEAYRERFLAMVSHDLFTPLTVVKGAISSVLADDVAWTVDEIKVLMEEADSETDRLEALMRQLLELSRLQAGGVPLDKGEEHLTQIIHVSMPQFRVLTEKHDFRAEVPPDLPPLHVDTTRIIQVMTNLVGNAAKYAPQGTEIALRASQDDERVVVSVSDQGPGIPAAEQQQVFDAFHRLEQTRAQKGSGLGLAICKELVEAHGGEIWIDAAAAQGTTVCFALPLAAPPQP